ncbi:hypothetical protein [Enterococcus sp. AZ136]|uniref:hypothetical protein n=1 Tax=Enterococcus sp. AZ136 TaxID=2774788 RepID=UPI003D2A274C
MGVPEDLPLIIGKYVNQQTLMKEFHIGFNTLKKLHLQGLKVIIIGRQHLYDLDDLTIILNQLKDSSSQ